ncbi:enoyl-CoA hydratase/isomerase family protein [Advenella kashmirensis]
MHKIESKIEETLLSEIKEAVLILTFNRPEALNALTLEMIRQIREEMEEAQANANISAILLCGSGDKAFCAGGDIRAIYNSFKSGNVDYLTFFKEEYELDYLIHNSVKPCIAWMDGYVMGGGMGLAQGCAARLATPKTRMAMPEVGIGYFPDAGGSYFLSRSPGSLGKYLGLTGAHLSAEDAVYAGLADFHISNINLPTVVDCLTKADWSLAPDEAVGSALRDFITPNHTSSALQDIRMAIDQHFGQSNLLSTMQSLEMEQRPDYATWAADTLALMNSRSPLAMSVTWEQLSRAKSMSLADCLLMEFELDRQWVPRGDLIEGIRALLVDKDRRPQWKHTHLEQIDAILVDSFFTKSVEPTLAL